MANTAEVKTRYLLASGYLQNQTDAEWYSMLIEALKSEELSINLINDDKSELSKMLATLSALLFASRK